MISFSRLGQIGRLGNQLFQVASMIGIAEKNNTQLSLPPWKYAEYFQGPFPRGPYGEQKIKEPHFHYKEDFGDLANGSYDFEGYFQSEKYFSKSVTKALSFKPEFRRKVAEKYRKVFGRPTIAISVRRGDYVDNPNYELLPARYYILALLKHFPDWQDRNILILSDDIPWCRLHFQCLPNVFFPEDIKNNDYFFSEAAIEQLCLMTLCNDFILSNSTFAWWGAWLGEESGSKIIRPVRYLAGNLAVNCDMKDHYPERWIPFDHTDKKIDLSDVTFTIPVHFDSKDRKQNIDLSVCMIQRDFDCKIIVGEQGSDSFSYFQKWCYYVKYDLPFFHRTKMLNDMAVMADTDVVVNYDCDVIIPPMQIVLAAMMLRTGESDFVYPYDGRFARVPREVWFKKIEKYLDLGVMGGEVFKGTRDQDAKSVGGCVMYRKNTFFKAGGENEAFCSWGPEDAEREYRWDVLGFVVRKVKGVLYHIDHWVGPNSSDSHGFVEKNRREWQKVKSMGSGQLLAYVKKWRNYAE